METPLPCVFIGKSAPDAAKVQVSVWLKELKGGQAEG
jgi:hypothetical protein